MLFLQGGASQQFAQIPLNLLPENGSADYIDTGIWSQKAIEEASRYGHVNVAATAKPYDYFAIPFLWLWLWIFWQAAAVGAVLLRGGSGAAANCVLCFLVAVLHHGAGGMGCGGVFGVQEVVTQ